MSRRARCFTVVLENGEAVRVQATKPPDAEALAALAELVAAAKSRMAEEQPCACPCHGHIGFISGVLLCQTCACFQSISNPAPPR